MNIHTALVANNPRAVIGGNNPPVSLDPATPIGTARGVYVNLMRFLKETPVIASANEAKTGANLIEQARATLGEMEDTRKALVKPFNEEVSAINEQYRLPRESIKSVMDEIKHRLTIFAAAEEAKRLHEAEEKRLAAEEAARQVREAERIEMAAFAEADAGVCDINVATAITQADRAFEIFKRADRAAARAEKAIPVRLAGGFGRAVSMRRSETLILDDATAALAAIGLTEAITEAILTAARAYRKLNGKLPAGVSAVTERAF